MMHMKKMVALLAALAPLGLASPVLATPTGEYAIFAGCPLANPAADACTTAKTESGEVTLGKKKVPITNTMTLQGGVHNVLNEEEELVRQEFIGAEGAETLSQTPQPVPGGLAGLVNCNELTNEVAHLACELAVESGLTGVDATTELAAPPSSIGIDEPNYNKEKGIAVSLPVKVRLENPLLGNECYIGSEASPIVLELTTGTTSPPAPNKPIKGTAGTYSHNEEGTIAKFTGGSLVDNAFAAPEASGCGGSLSSVLDPIIDSEIGLPSAAGHNTAILDGTLYQANAGAVREH